MYAQSSRIMMYGIWNHNSLKNKNQSGGCRILNGRHNLYNEIQNINFAFRILNMSAWVCGLVYTHNFGPVYHICCSNFNSIISYAWRFMAKIFSFVLLNIGYWLQAYGICVYDRLLEIISIYPKAFGYFPNETQKIKIME